MTILTLLALGVLVGAFFYVAVIGSRAAETTRARVAADATAMAAATVKAKVMNYEAYLLLADSALLPLAQIADGIGAAQVAGSLMCPATASFLYCAIKYVLRHVVRTQRRRGAVRNTMTEWLDGLEDMADRLRTVGPQWAELAAARTGTAAGYRSGTQGVTAAASFPVPTLDPNSPCTRLGIELVGNGTPSRDGGSSRDACHDRSWLELVYMGASFDPTAFLLDELGLIVTGHSLFFTSCSRRNRVPRLAADWKSYSVSRGMAISETPGDRYFQGRLESLRGTTPPANLQTGYLLGMACAEHYAQDHNEAPSLWHMDWRARLVPCDFDQDRNVRPIRQCGALSFGAVYPGPTHVAKMQAQFERERMLGAARYWHF